MKTLITFIKNIKSFYRLCKKCSDDEEICSFVILKRDRGNFEDCVYSGYIAEMDEWFVDNRYLGYRYIPSEKSKMMVILGKTKTYIFIDGVELKGTEIEVEKSMHYDNTSPSVVKIYAKWRPLDEDGNQTLEMHGVKINC